MENPVASAGIVVRTSRNLRAQEGAGGIMTKTQVFVGHGGRRTSRAAFPQPWCNLACELAILSWRRHEQVLRRWEPAEWWACGSREHQHDGKKHWRRSLPGMTSWRESHIVSSSWCMMCYPAQHVLNGQDRAHWNISFGDAMTRCWRQWPKPSPLQWLTTRWRYLLWNLREATNTANTSSQLILFGIRLGTASWHGQSAQIQTSNIKAAKTKCIKH